MLKDIVAVQALSRHQLMLRFEDGLEGIIDVSKLIRFDGVFKPLADAGFLSKFE